MAEHTVYGPPGTGKTTYLARQVQRAASKYGGGAVAVASFTRAAAAEVAGRGTGIPEQNIGTLHAHAFRALDRPKLLENSEGLAAWNKWVPDIGLRLTVKSVAADPENAPSEASYMQGSEQAEDLYAAMNILRAKRRPREFWPPRVQHFDRYWREFQDEAGYSDFTSWLERCLDEGVGMRSEPYILLLDEAQDFSRLEMELARQWAQDAHDLIVVGDPDQNLYEWRGADPRVFRSEEAESVIVLDQSYRVPAAVQREAQAWIGQITDRHQTLYSPRDEEGVCVRSDHALDDPAALLLDIESKLDAGKTVMVLCSCGFMLAPLLFQCRERGVPFHNPYRTKAGHWNPLAHPERVLSFLKPQIEAWGDEADFWRWWELKKWSEVLRSSDTMEKGAKQAIAARCLADRFGDSQRDDYVDAGMLFGQLLKQEGLEHVYQGDLDWWEENLLDSHRKSQAFPLRVARRHGPARLRERPRLIVGTIHSVKGGEADVVYLFPDLSGAGFYGQWRSPHRDPVIRQFYVGMTRARQELYLCQPSRPEAVPWL